METNPKPQNPKTPLASFQIASKSNFKQLLKQASITAKMESQPSLEGVYKEAYKKYEASKAAVIRAEKTKEMALEDLLVAQKQTIE